MKVTATGMMAASLSLFAPLAPVAAQPVTFVCNFTFASMLTGGTQFAPEQFQIKRVNHSMTFVIDGQRAYMVGNLGTANVELFTMKDGTVFIEPTPSGNRQVTVIDRDGNAVHSRHTIGPHWEGTKLKEMLFPSQYYGHCARKD